MTDKSASLRSLMVRRRRDDGQDNRWLGYDELVDGQPTGRIVMGWHFGQDGKLVYHYAKQPPETVVRRRGAAPETEPVAVEAFVTAERSEEAGGLEVGGLEVGEGREPEMAAAAPQLDAALSALATRFVITFDWAYGEERCVVDREADILPQQQAILGRFAHLDPKNWRVHAEHFVEAPMQWPQSSPGS